MFLQSAVPFILYALASAASIPSSTPTLSQPLNATRTRWVIPGSQVTLDIFTWPPAIGTADQVRSVLNDVVTSIRNSEHYPAGVFDSLEVAVVPNETDFLILNVGAGRPSLSPKFTYEMAAFAVTGLHTWLTTYVWTEKWPLIWVSVVFDGVIIGKLEFDHLDYRDVLDSADEFRKRSFFGV